MTSILLSRLPLVEKKLISLNKRAEKRGLEPFVLTTGKISSRKVEVSADLILRLDYIGVEITGELPKIEGYKLLGIKNTIDGIDMFFGDFPMDQKHDNNCDHCNSKRLRTFIAAVEKDGKTQLIGSTCFKHVFNDISADQLIMFGRSLRMVDEFADDGESRGYSSSVYEPRRFVAAAIKLIDINGYVSKAQDDVYNTCKEVMEVYDIIFTPEDRHLEKADEVLEYYKNLDSKAAFDTSMKNILESRYITDKHAGLATFAYVGYKKSIESNKAKGDITAQNALSEYVGTIKKREDFELELVNISSFEGQWGTTYYYTFKTGDNVVCWKASSAISFTTRTMKEDDKGEWEEILNHYAETGDVITLKGTVAKQEVKKNEKFGDRKTTHISRCKVLAVVREGEKLL